MTARKISLQLAILLAVLLTLTAPAIADELSVRTAIETTAWTLLKNGKFDELNKLAEHYRTSGEKTPSGHPKLDLFYIGLRTPPAGKSVIELQWGDMFLQAHRWVQERPSPAAHIALANLYIENAWLARGDGYAKTVNPEQWGTFFSLLELARKELETSKEMADIDPGWYQAMLKVQRGEQWPPEQSVELFGEAIQKNKYYFPIYNEIIYTLQPEWGGSWEAVEKFASHAADYTKDAEGDEMYARLFWSSIECGCDNAERHAGNWTRIKAGFRDILSRYPVPWNLNNYAYIACLEYDKATEQSLLRKISKPMIAGWGGKKDNYELCRSWAFGSDK